MIMQITRPPMPALTDGAAQRAYAALPDYPKFGATVAKYRRLPRTPENVNAHAGALFAQLRTIQRAEWARSLASEPDNPRAPCASGTWHTDGEAICRAVRQHQAAALARALADDHAKRTDRQVGYVLRETLAGRDVAGLVIHANR